MSKPSALVGDRRPLSLSALDAVLSAANGKPLRRDRLARDDRVYRWLIRRAQKEGDYFRTTYAEAAKGAGYDVEPLTCRAARRRAKERRVSTIRRALGSLRAAGLVDFRGCLKENGQWRCLEVRLLPNARGVPPRGRSQRRPARCPGARISFSSQSGYSPAVPPSAGKAQKRVPVRARASSGSGRRQQARRSRDRDFSAGEWPIDAFELQQQELVELCNAFELAFGRPANFSFTRHGPILRRVLARFDRYSGPGWQSGAGLAWARTLVQAFAKDAKLGLRSEATINSLAYFLPIFDEASKDQRRHWKRHWEPRWADERNWNHDVAQTPPEQSGSSGGTQRESGAGDGGPDNRAGEG